MVKIGDRLVVQNMQFPAFVERIEADPETGNIAIFLDWREHGKSRVWLHDENKTWHRFVDLN